ncbi:MAG: hypothetical protein QMC62_11855 [Alteromonadaceae bacterium]
MAELVQLSRYPIYANELVNIGGGVEVYTYKTKEHKKTHLCVTSFAFKRGEGIIWAKQSFDQADSTFKMEKLKDSCPAYSDKKLANP